MTKEQRDELREEERKLRDSLIDTFGEKSEVVKAFDEMSKAMNKEADKSIEKEHEKAKKAKAVEEEIKGKIDEIKEIFEKNKDLCTHYDFGLILGMTTIGTPSVFGAIGTNKVLRKTVVPFIKDQLEENGIV